MDNLLMEPFDTIALDDGSTLELWPPFPPRKSTITVRLCEGGGPGSSYRAAAVDWTRGEVEQVIARLQVALEKMNE